jgi:hypothetical protein
MNLGGPSETVCSAGYTVKSGVIKPMSLAHLTLANNDVRYITPLLIIHAHPLWWPKLGDGKSAVSGRYRPPRTAGETTSG